MQFKVPQFLDIEDKIFGPFTFRQFVYLAGGAGLCFILFKLLGFLAGSIPILIVGGFSLTLTFYRPNNKPFIYMLEAGFNYFIGDKLYVWDKKALSSDRKIGKEPIKPSGLLDHNVKLSGSKLRDLAWSLDVLDLKK